MSESTDRGQIVNAMEFIRAINADELKLVSNPLFAGLVVAWIPGQQPPQTSGRLAMSCEGKIINVKDCR